ncbi:MAG: hypothetical protein R3203_16435, partial [Pseudoalteromonas tetraodonis]|nr:hypothetical protein [Pseudoalteromonas tetraodonis]
GVSSLPTSGESLSKYSNRFLSACSSSDDGNEGSKFEVRGSKNKKTLWLTSQGFFIEIRCFARDPLPVAR